MSQLVRTPLWQHQLEDAKYLEEEPRALIGNDMGSGKTLLAVERDLRLRRDGGDRRPTLVVAPLNTHDGWEATYTRETGLRVKRIDRKDRPSFIKDEADVYIMHYEALRLMPELRNFFGHGIFDECHRLKNRKAKTTVAAKKLNIPYLTDMSGSIATSKPDDIWSTLNHLKPQTYRSYWKFYELACEYEITYPQGYRKTKGPTQWWKTTGLQQIRPFYVRRTKAELMPNLPPKVHGRIIVDLEPAQRRAYDQMKKDMIAWVKDHEGFDSPLVAAAVVSQLQRLQMFAMANMSFNADGKAVMSEPSSKLDALMELFEDNPDEQFVVFSQFKQPLILLSRRLEKAKISYGTLTGDDTDKQRKENKAGFIGGTRRIFMGTISAGGVGVDGLQEVSNTVIFLDRAWQPLLNVQAEDRLHRGGQVKTVNVIDIMARNTVDFSRFDEIEMKKEWILQTLGDK